MLRIKNSPLTSPLLIPRCSARFASQEINPIVHRLQHNQDNVPFDRNAARQWNQVFYAPHAESAMWRQYAPFMLQGLRMRKYLDGYLHNKVLFGQPLIHRTVAGNYVRLFVYGPAASTSVKWNEIENALSKIFGMYQGPGTSGRMLDDNERQGRVKTRLEVIELPSPLLHAEILAQYVARLLVQQNGASSIYDKLANLVSEATPRRAKERGVVGLPIAGFRLRIKGRPRGEDMATKHDFMKGSCPKKDENAWIDFGKHSYLSRSGIVGVKAWVHYQRPHRQDESGSAAAAGLETDAMPAAINLLKCDQDYDPALASEFLAAKEASSSDRNAVGGLWNAQYSHDPVIESMVRRLNELHQ